MLSFRNKKSLRFVVSLIGASFDAAGNNVITIEGLRASVDIDKAGGQMMGELRAQIYGMKQSDMNSVTTLQWKPNNLIRKTVEVYAIDGAQETLVFQGNIVNAWGNYNSQPDVFLQIQAQAAYFNQLSPVPPRSYKGVIDVATVMRNIASSMGYVFENNGVDLQLSDVYLANTDLVQAKALARAADIDLYVDNKILAITPRNTPRGTLVPEISDQSGLIGYPTFDGIGVNFGTYFNPAVTFGGRVKLVTSIPQAAGEWIVTSISYKLESEKPGGQWTATIRGNAIGLAITK